MNTPEEAYQKKKFIREVAVLVSSEIKKDQQLFPDTWKGRLLGDCEKRGKDFQEEVLEMAPINGAEVQGAEEAYQKKKFIREVGVLISSKIKKDQQLFPDTWKGRLLGDCEERGKDFQEEVLEMAPINGAEVQGAEELFYLSKPEPVKLFPENVIFDLFGEREELPSSKEDQCFFREWLMSDIPESCFTLEDSAELLTTYDDKKHVLPMSMTYGTNLREFYKEWCCWELWVWRGLVEKVNWHQVPKLFKVSLNRGIGENSKNSKEIENSLNESAMIAGQYPITNTARKSVAGFKIRVGMIVGCSLTLRRDRMYNFLSKLRDIVLPRIRDFRGIKPNSFDGNGNYSVGVTEQLVFPEILYDGVTQLNGFNISIVTSAKTDALGYSLLGYLGFPFFTGEGDPLKTLNA